MSNTNNTLLYGVASSGKIKTWKAYSDFSLNSDGHVTITVEWGYKDGALQTKLRTVKAGKNKGKSNETTIQQQAALQLEQLYKAQIDSNYVYQEQLETLKANPPKNAMLAHPYQKKMHTLPLDENGNFTEVVYIQPKLNGIRNESRRSEKSVDFISRTNKPFTSFDHLVPSCLSILKEGTSFDSELFHKDLPFEYIASMVNAETDRVIYDENKNVIHTVDEIQLYAYDLMGYDDLTFTERLAILQELAKQFPPSIVLVETLPVKSLAEVRAYHAKWKNEGYEGLMIRVGSGLYEYSKRSINLLKYKEMEQAEFRIVKIYTAENDPNKVMFTLWSEEGQATFDCALKGDKLENLKYLKDPEKYLECYLTVDYQVLSQCNMPLFPVGIAVRAGTVVDGKFIPDV